MKVDLDNFWKAYKEEFNSVTQKQLNAIESLLHGFEIFKEWTDYRQVAYALATIKHETANTFEPITEYGNRSYFDKYDGREDLGNTQKGDGFKFRGRGYVQITGRKNYEKFSNLLGIDLLVNPELALLISNALYILTVGMQKGLFTGRKLSDYINSSEKDYVNARKIINRLDKANTIASYAKQFETILSKSATDINGRLIQTEKSLTLLKRGSKGEGVSKLQYKLLNLGYNVKVDGIFLDGTLAAVKQFQTKYGLTSDGIAGKQTLEKLGL